MLIKTVALWNHDGDVRRIDFGPGLNVITGSSQTGKSAMIEIIRYCLGDSDFRVPAGPIADSVAYYGMLLVAGETPLFLGRPALAVGQQTSSEAQLEIGLTDLPEADQLEPNTNTDTMRDYLGQAIGIEQNRFDPPEGATRPPLVAKLAHALIHCFQRQDEIASRSTLFHKQGEPFMPQAIKDTLPYFLGVTGPEQLRRAAQLAALRRELNEAVRRRRETEETLTAGAADARGLLSQAADAGLTSAESEVPTTLADALARLREVRDAPVPAAPLQAPGEEFDRLQIERRELAGRLRTVREQRALAAAITQSGEAAESESVEQVVRLQRIGIVGGDHDPDRCPVCEQPLETPPPAAEQMREALRALEVQIDAVERDRPSLVEVDAALAEQARAIREQLEGNTAALGRLARSAEAVERHQTQLDIGTFVRGRIDHFLERAVVMTPPQLTALRQAEERLGVRIAELEEQLDPARVREEATSVLVGVGRRMTEMAKQLGLEHAETGVRVHLGRLTVVADTPTGPIYMDTSMGSAKNWVGYHLATVLSLQEHFVAQTRPVPSLLVLDQPTQAFFTPDRADDADDQDRADALAQFAQIRDSVEATGGRLQVLVLDHADFSVKWFQDAVIERWRDGEALIPSDWLREGTAEGKQSSE